MKVKCILETEDNLEIKEINVESNLYWRDRTVKLIVGSNEVVVSSAELIKAINNCTNC